MASSSPLTTPPRGSSDVSSLSSSHYDENAENVNPRPAAAPNLKATNPPAPRVTKILGDSTAYPVELRNAPDFTEAESAFPALPAYQHPDASARDAPKRAPQPEIAAPIPVPLHRPPPVSVLLESLPRLTHTVQYSAKPPPVDDPLSSNQAAVPSSNVHAQYGFPLAVSQPRRVLNFNSFSLNNPVMCGAFGSTSENKPAVFRSPTQSPYAPISGISPPQSAPLSARSQNWHFPQSLQAPFELQPRHQLQQQQQQRAYNDQLNTQSTGSASPIPHVSPVDAKMRRALVSSLSSPFQTPVKKGDQYLVECSNTSSPIVPAPTPQPICTDEELWEYIEELLEPSKMEWIERLPEKMDVTDEEMAGAYEAGNIDANGLYPARTWVEGGYTLQVRA
ncbi:hypothetical protein HMN09_01312900 [Mycena chlorophos]|uniref:Uncharacterized protein n=1 Tax=Mycena chlorophos TaxID=658473 RepID=A0A8H6S0H7_MYCCL|nr:hypothetical protein HMN09_01312900 [Mycena chlorophos]